MWDGPGLRACRRLLAGRGAPLVTEQVERDPDLQPAKSNVLTATCSRNTATWISFHATARNATRDEVGRSPHGREVVASGDTELGLVAATRTGETATAGASERRRKRIGGKRHAETLVPEAR